MTKASSVRPIKDRINYHGSSRLILLSFISTVIGSICLYWQLWHSTANRQLIISSIVFSLILLACGIAYFGSQKKQWQGRFTAFFLCSTFILLIVMRLAAIANFTLTVWVFSLPLFCKVLNYIIAAYNDIKEARARPDILIHHNTGLEWQLLFIRLFIGFDLVPHFTEKLFAGPGPRMDDVQAFVHLGVPHALSFVIVAGLIEFAGALAVGCGFLTRLGSVCLFIYLMVATYMGHHFTLGFIWASPGGGWEYPVLWSTLILSFAIFGGSGFSLDHVIRDRFQVPRWILFLMGTRGRSNINR